MSTVASIRFSDLIPLAWSSLRRNRLRSGLTIGAISVGISLVVYLISLGYGLEQLTLGSVQRSAALLSLTVETASKDLNPLNQAAVDKIKAVDGAAKVLPRMTIKGQMSLDGAIGGATIVGVDPDYLQITDATQIKVGRYYRPEDERSMVVTTGFLHLFGLDTKKVPLVFFTLTPDPDAYPGAPVVTGINVTGIVDADDSQVAYFPRPYLENLTNNQFGTYEHVKVTVPTIDQIDSVRTALVARGFKVSAAIDTVDDIKKAFSWIRAILATLGLIAIFIATIGMFNTLTISLLERTKEIGIMKALGVRKVDISRLFLTEAALMGILGGIFGLLGAFFLQQLTLFILSLLAAVANGTVPIIFENHPLLVLGAFVFAILIAMVTGFYPSRRATRLNPIEAIRHE